jgi:hypothetical protein
MNGTNGTAPAAPAPVTGPDWPTRPKRAFELDAAVYLESVNTRLTALQNDRDRAEWLDARLVRYAKYRGWITEEKTTPWEGAADVQPPLLQIAELRTNAGLHNALMATRPLLQAKASAGRPDFVAREEKITALLDAQLFTDPGPARAERVFGDYTSNFLQDGNAVGYTPWVRDIRTRTAYLYRPPVPPGMDADAYLIGILQSALPGFDEASIERDPDKVNVYTARFSQSKERPPDEATITVYRDEDGYLQIELARPVTLYDGPVMLNLAIEDVYIPSRVENLQPPSDANPKGAPYVFVKLEYGLDQVRRHQADGKFNFCTDETLTALESHLRGTAGTQPFAPDADALPAQKAAMEGVSESTPPVTDDADLVHLRQPTLLCFDRWTVKGETEDILAVVALDESLKATHLLEARCLSELYPGDRPWRPFGEACCIPVPGRYYGISLLELGEHLHDYIKGLLDQAADAHAITGIPFFFYSATAKLSQEVMRLQPGEGIPAPGDPRATIYFPNIPARDQQYTFQALTFALQLFERLLMIGDLQLGRVPTGKASALRTVGTTMALLQQGDVRADQLLLRLFSGLQQIAGHFHRMNRHLLPPGKEIRRVGWDGDRAQAYLTFEQGATDVDLDMDFEFRPDFLMANPQVLAATLQTALAVIATPLGFQTGIVGPDQFYRLVRDYCKAARLDYKQYLQRPAGEPGEPITAEDAIGSLVNGKLPVGPPLEGPEAHMQKLIEFHASDAFGVLTPDRVELFKAYWLTTSDRLKKSRLAQAAAQTQEALAQTIGQSASGSSGAETSVQEPDATAQTPGAAEMAAPAPSAADSGGQGAGY